MFSLKIRRYTKCKMWKGRLFHATDFQSLMYPCFTFCQILGLFPYKFNVSTLEASKPRYIVSSVVIYVSCIFYGTFIYDLIAKINLESTPRTLETVCVYIISSFIMIITHVMSGPRMRLLQTILKISSKLPLKSYQKLSRMIYIKDVLGTIILIVNICIYFPKTHVFNCLNGLAAVFTLYGVLLIFQINMLYINCVYVLKACFKNINDNLTHMQRFVINDTKSSVSTIGHMQRNQFLSIELKILKKQHLVISDTVQMLNVIFSLQVLATIVLVFSNITFEFYFYAVRWQDGIRIVFDKNLFDIFLITMTYHVILITLLVWACETGKNQAQEIRLTIHNLLNDTSDEEIKDELKLFSLQILHCGNTFSVKGLTVDATLLAAMMGSITTYMLILIQFMVTSHSCDGEIILHK